MGAMIFKEFRQLRRDRRTVAMIVVLPILLLTVFGFAANFTISELRVVVTGPQATAVMALLDDPPATSDVTLTIVEVLPDGTAADARAALRDNEAELAVVTGGDRPIVFVDGSQLFAAQSARFFLAQLGDAVETEILFNPELKTSWVMVPAIIGLILTFIGTIITSVGLVREREEGTLEQLAVMPFSPMAVIVGKIAPYFLLASLDMIVVTLAGMWLFDVPFNGNPTVFALGAGLFLFVVLGLGVLISTVSQNTGQAIQLAIMTLLPQVLLSGMIFPLEAMAAGVRWIGYLLPLTWFNTIARGVMLRGATIESLWLPLLILAVLAVAMFGAAVLRLRGFLAPAPTRVTGSLVAEGV